MPSITADSLQSSRCLPSWRTFFKLSHNAEQLWVRVHSIPLYPSPWNNIRSSNSLLLFKTLLRITISLGLSSIWHCIFWLSALRIHIFGVNESAFQLFVIIIITTRCRAKRFLSTKAIAFEIKKSCHCDISRLWNRYAACHYRNRAK